MDAAEGRPGAGAVARQPAGGRCPVVRGPELVSVRLTETAHAHGLELALPERVRWVLARPTGFNRADAINIRIPIEGAGELVDRTA